MWSTPRREDWERDPFKLFEENGYFYGRGTADMKGEAAVWLDLMVRFKQEKNFKPSRDLIMALTCGEETSNRVNGVDYILQNKRDLIDAAFALNEGGGGLLSEAGKPLALQVQAGEKIHQVYSLEVTNPGGHSSRPMPDNAIYRLMQATTKVSQLSFPIAGDARSSANISASPARMLGGDDRRGDDGRGEEPERRRRRSTTLMADPTYNARSTPPASPPSSKAAMRPTLCRSARGPRSPAASCRARRRSR